MNKKLSFKVIIGLTIPNTLILHFSIIFGVLAYILVVEDINLPIQIYLIGIFATTLILGIVLWLMEREILRSLFELPLNLANKSILISVLLSIIIYPIILVFIGLAMYIFMLSLLFMVGA